MDFRILGPLAVHEGNREVTPSRAQAKSLLGLFLLHPNERLSTDRMIDALWGEAPPTTAEKAVQGLVSGLRKLLGPKRIQTQHGGYRLEVRPGELDLDRFTAAVATARATRPPAERSSLLTEALALWRGEPLADLAGERFAVADRGRLDEQRLAAQEERLAADLECGRHADVLSDLERLVDRHPLREGARGSLMLALYRAGRQSDALRIYREGRRRLADELGIEPSPELQQLEQRILAHDPALAAPAASAARGPVRQERKTVTVLVVEVVLGTMDPEELERVATPALRRLRELVERVGGRPEPLFSNAMIGVFGAPRAHDDDPLRAVRAALDLLHEAATMGYRVRGGIETGEALVTIDGPDVSVTGHVLGDASRLQATARPGSIVVGPATHRATERSIDYEPRGPDAWAPTAVAAGRAAAPVEAPFTGRSEDLALLERIHARSRDERSVQLVTVTAEPGGGKSRLVQELRRALEASPQPPAWREGRCLPYGEGITYWALGEIVKAQAGILVSDDAHASGQKLATAIAALEPDDARRAWLHRSLGALIGIGGATASPGRDQSFAAWRRFLEALAADRPAIVVFEDIHWADEELLAFIDHVVTQASGVPVVVLCTARLELLEAHPSWAGGKRNATTIALAPLGQAETEALLTALLGRPPSAETVRRAGGNPLYAHELARVLGHEPSGEPASVPESLQAVIAAHLDALAPELKAVASDAAVVGEVFWPGAIAAIAAIDEVEVEARLARLISNDVARRRRTSSVARQSEYEFLHVLVRDVAYGQIPRRDRVGRHRAAARWIEELAGDRVAGHAELIAHHYVEALEIARALGADADVRELLPRARTFLTLAGEAAQTVALPQAEASFRRALDLADPTDSEHGVLLGRLAEVAELRGRLDEAEDLCRAAIRELTAQGDAPAAGEIMTVLATVLWRLGRPEAERRQVARDAVRTLEALPPGPPLVRAYARMATHELHAGRAKACGAWARKGLALAEGLGVAALKVQPLHLLGIARFETGDDAGIEDLRTALRLGLEAGLSAETAAAHTNLAAVTWVTAGPAAALELKGAAAAFAASRGLAAMERTIRAESLWQLHDAGRWDEALALADELVAGDGAGQPSRIATMARTVKARILADRGQMEEAGRVEASYLARARELRDPQDLGPALAAAAALRVAQGDAAAAVPLLAELEHVTRGRDPSQRIHELPHVARVCLAAGSMDVAERLLRTRGAPTYTRAPLCLLSARGILAEARGDLAEAIELQAAAVEGWRRFGCPLEEAYSALALGRCLKRAGQPAEARAALRRALGTGRRLGAVGLRSEADALLGEVVPA